MTYITHNSGETEDLGRRLAERLDTAVSRHVMIALRGEMGVGKTAFVRGFASHFGIRGVKSPTYTVVNEYRGRVNIFHFDMYRIESEDDLYSIGFDDYTSRDGYSVIEWSENIDGALPSDAVFVKISRTAGDPDERNIEIYQDEGHEDLSI